MAKKAKSKAKRLLVCITVPIVGGSSEVCSLMTRKETKKVYGMFKAKGKFVKEITKF